MEVGGRGVGVVTSNGEPMRIPAGHRIVRVACTLIGTAEASARVTLGVRTFAAPAEQRAEHVLGTVALARPDEPRVVTPGRRSGTSAPVERILFSEVADARGVLDVAFLVTCAVAPPEPFESASVEARLFADAGLTLRAMVLRPSRRYYAAVVTTHGGAPVALPLLADAGCTAVVTSTGVEVTTLTSTVAALRTEPATIGGARYAASRTVVAVGDAALGVDAPAGFVLQRSAGNVALPLQLRDSAGEMTAAQVVERFGEYPTITVRGSALTAVGGAYTLSVSASADVSLSISEARVGGAKLAFDALQRTVLARAPPTRAAFLATPWSTNAPSFVVRVSTDVGAAAVSSVARATVRTTTGAEFRARATASGDVTVTMQESARVYSATLTGIVCADGTRAAELTAYAPQGVRLVAKTRGGDALVYGDGQTAVAVEAHRLHGVGALGSALTVTALAGFSYTGGTLTVTTPITTDGTVDFASVTGTATGDDGAGIAVSANVGALVIGTSTRLVGTPWISTPLGEIEASVATGSCAVTRIRAPLLGSPAPRLELAASGVAEQATGGSGSVTSTDVLWAPAATYSPTGTPTLILTNVGCALGDRKTTIARLTVAMQPTTTYALALVATTALNFGVAGGAPIVDGATSLPNPVTSPFVDTFGTLGTIYLALRVAGADEPIVACASVEFENTAGQVSQAADYAARSAAQQEVLARGTAPYWRLVTHGATTVLGVFVGASFALRTVRVGACAASGGRVAPALVYTRP